MSNSYIKLIIGPMYSGKSSELIRIISRYEHTNKKCIMVNNILDVREDTSIISTHSKFIKNKNAIKCKNLIDFSKMNEYKNADVIGIDECQFFPDLLLFVKLVDKTDKILIMSGLDGNFNREPFGEILQCIPYCDNIIKLNAMCMICKDGTKAIFSKRTIENEIEILIGKEESYIAVCRKCFN